MQNKPNAQVFGSLLNRFTVVKSDSPKKLGKTEDNQISTEALTVKEFLSMSADDKLLAIMQTIVSMEKRISNIEAKLLKKSDDGTQQALSSQKSALIKLSGMIKGIAQKVEKLETTTSSKVEASPEPEPEITPNQMLAGLLSSPNACSLRNTLGAKPIPI